MKNIKKNTFSPGTADIVNINLEGKFLQKSHNSTLTTV